MREFIKHDLAKARFDFIPSDGLAAGVRAMLHGAEKYSADNWDKAECWMSYVNAITRHALALGDGQEIDPDSGLHHLDHLVACALFGAALRARGKPRYVDNANRLLRGAP